MSILEPIIALALFAVVITNTVATAFQAQKLVLASELRLEDLAAAQNLLEDAQVSLKQNWLSAIPAGVSVSEIDDFTKTLTARAGTVELRATVTDWKNAKDATLCGPLSGNWESPQILSYLDTGPSNPATGAVAKSNLLFVSADSATASKPDLFIYDISNPVSPVFLSSLNTGPGSSSLALAGKYIFLGNQSINGQLEVVDVSNPSSPVLMKTYKLPGVYTDNTTIANTLVYSRGKIYLGTAKSQIAELHVIDVSDPLSPVEVGSFEINAGINSLNVRGYTVFVASPAGEEVKALDVSEPGSIVRVGGYDAPGGSGNGKSLLRITDSLFMGRTVGGNELNFLDVANSSTINLIASKNINTSINGMAGTPEMQFIITGDPAKKFQVWKNMSLYSSFSPAGSLTSVACQHNLVFVTASAPDGVIIIGPG